MVISLLAPVFVVLGTVGILAGILAGGHDGSASATTSGPVAISTPTASSTPVDPGAPTATTPADTRIPVDDLQQAAVDELAGYAKRLAVVEKTMNKGTRVPPARIAALRSATVGWIGTNHLLIAGRLAPITAVARLSVKLLDAMRAAEAPGAGKAEIDRLNAMEQVVYAAAEKAGALEFRHPTS